MNFSEIEGDKRYEFRKAIFKNRTINRVFIYSSAQSMKKIFGFFSSGLCRGAT